MEAAVWHEGCGRTDGRTDRRFCFLLVRQDVNKGHWKDTLPFRLSFDVPNLQGERNS